MPGKRRYHDESPYGRGFQAGYTLHPLQHRPDVPEDLRGQRAINGWRRGFQAGGDARERKRSIDRRKAAEELARAIRWMEDR